MSNHLANETSPYLLQHAENPVDWYPWCDEAFCRARTENKPVFLSIGYSTCHWCHVMERESFEDKKVADFLNSHFICVKVDREERPDIDSVYMSVCQAFTGSGGWPMSIFMTWDKRPFFAGTYFPKEGMYTALGFLDILKNISDLWDKDPNAFSGYAENIMAHIKSAQNLKPGAIDENAEDKAAEIFFESFDNINGGFGSAPKFPSPHNLLFLTLYASQKNDNRIMAAVEKTLLQMRMGGIFDQIGFGFCRYSTDKYFLVPHFEKMLYDNALLIMAYCAAYSKTGKDIFLDTAKKTADYILSEMTSPEGGFYSAQDADSEGEEGKYYTLSYKEVIDILGPLQGKKFAEAFDITEKGNFEGLNVPNLLKSRLLNEDFTPDIKKLYEYRKKRFTLKTDDKIIMSWNCLAIAAFSMLGKVSHSEKYTDAAKKAFSFAEKNLCSGVKLYTSFRSAKHSESAVLDDYAFYTAALIGLYDSTLDKSYLKLAEDILSETLRLFYDEEHGGFYLCRKDSGELFINPKETYDGALPSGNSVMAYNFTRLYQLTENARYYELNKKQVKFMLSRINDYPHGSSMFLLSYLLYKNPPPHIVCVIKDPSDFKSLIYALPFLSNAVTEKESEKYKLLNGKTTYYICKDHICLPPSNTLSFDTKQ